ncbi:hypothetical protein [Rufibacter soli]
MNGHSYFEGFLFANGWVPTEKTVFTFFLWRWGFDLTERRYRSPYTGRCHKLAKALKKETRMQDVTQALFI